MLLVQTLWDQILAFSLIRCAAVGMLLTCCVFCYKISMISVSTSGAVMRNMWDETKRAWKTVSNLHVSCSEPWQKELHQQNHTSMEFTLWLIMRVSVNIGQKNHKGTTEGHQLGHRVWVALGRTRWDILGSSISRTRSGKPGM